MNNKTLDSIFTRFLKMGKKELRKGKKCQKWHQSILSTILNRCNMKKSFTKTILIFSSDLTWNCPVFPAFKKLRNFFQAEIRTCKEIEPKRNKISSIRKKGEKYSIINHANTCLLDEYSHTTKRETDTNTF